MTLEEKMNQAEERGLAFGLEEGRKSGLAEGKREVAKRLKKAGLDLELISSNTGLTIEEVEKL